DDVVARLNATRPVVMLDTFEELGDLIGLLREEVVPRLETDVRLVIAGRYPLGRAWSGEGTWRQVIRHLPLAGFSPAQSRADVGAAFDRLCQLSVVRPAEHGLMLHDDVRRILADDLRWRRPQRYTDLRLRALAYDRERMRSAAPEEQEWLLAERFYLWGNA